MSALSQGQFFTPRPAARAWGQLTTIVGNKPAVGAPWRFVAPGGYLTRIVSLRTILIASAQAATRVPAVFINDGAGNVFYSASTNGSVAAGITSDVTVSETNISPIVAINPVINIPIVPLMLPPGMEVEGFTTGLQTEDQFAAPVLLVEQFEPDPIHPLAEIAAEVHKILIAEGAMTVASI